MEDVTVFTREIMEALGSPFPEDEVEFLPRATSGGQALGLPYIDARSVMRRLDAVVGPGNWSFDFDVLSPDGKMVRGKLTVLGVTKCDAGEANAEDEALKSAVSDALKRAAVHFGIGRYLYYLPRVWAPYDSQKRRFTEQPRLDRAAVDKALAICGITTRPANNRPVTNGAASHEPTSRGGARKSMWSAGSEPGGEDGPKDTTVRESGAPVPESRGDRAAVRVVAGGEPAAGAETSAPQALACSRAECGKALTKGQHDVSVRAYGQPLCPACQKLQARAA